MNLVQHLVKTHLEYEPKRIAAQITKPQANVLGMLAGGWEAVQRHGSVYEINGTSYQGPTFHSLAKAGLAEWFVLVPGEYPTHAYRVTQKGRDVAAHL